MNQFSECNSSTRNILKSIFLTLRVSFLLLLGIDLIFAQQRLPPNLEEMFDNGVQALRAGRLDEAEKSFQGVLQRGGKLAFVYNNLGIVYQCHGENKRAVAAFRIATRLNPRYAAPRVLMGASLLTLGNTTEALRQLQVAAKLDSKQPLIHLELAKAYKQTGDILQMVSEYSIASRLDSQNSEYIYQLGHAYRELAEWCYRQMMRSNPHSARIYQAIAENYRVEGKTQSAIRAYERAAQIDPKLPGIHLALAQIYVELGQLNQAKEEALQELALEPESAEARGLKEKLDLPPPH